MTKERDCQWMRIWECIRAGNGTLQIENLHSLLDVLWQEQRKNSTPKELAGHAGAWALET
jgi:hypothetical protein